MLHAIQGRLDRQGPTRVLLETGGLTFEVHVPLSTYEKLGPSGSQARLLVHLHIREDEWRVFGFVTAEERQAFRALLKVAGVGPTTALALLSGFRPGELGRAVTQGDARALTRVKGVGKKTAERIVVELRDVLGEGAGAGAELPEGDRRTVEDALAALAALGFDPSEARRRLEKAIKAGGAEGVSELVRRALRA